MRAVRSLVAAGSALAAGGTLLAAVNQRHIRRPAQPTSAIAERVSVLLPMRDEAPRADQCLRAVLAQRALTDLEVIVIDDGSTDNTADIVASVMKQFPAVNARLIRAENQTPPEGWIGKPWACERLSKAATGSALVFVDADVTLEPDAVASAVALLREMNADLISPYPRQRADGPLPRLVQPLLQWSWFSTVPLKLSEKSPRPSLAVANGQFLVVDSVALSRAGGFEAVKSEVLDDVALLRAVKSTGGSGTVVDGTTIATCRMYETGDELIAGYTKSLWSAFKSPAGAAAVMSVMGLAYIAPPVAAALAPTRTTRLIGLGGYAFALAGRVIVARTTGQRTLPDVLAHPISIGALASLTAASWVGRKRGTLTWKGRPVEAAT